MVFYTYFILIIYTDAVVVEGYYEDEENQVISDEHSLYGWLHVHMKSSFRQIIIYVFIFLLQINTEWRQTSKLLLLQEKSYWLIRNSWGTE